MSAIRKTSASSPQGVPTGRKVSGTLPKVSHREVEFTPEEMAIDCPLDTSDSETYQTITRGDKDWKKFIKFRNGFVRLDPELRRLFRSSASVNTALRRLISAEGEMPARSSKGAKSH